MFKISKLVETDDPSGRCILEVWRYSYQPSKAELEASMSIPITPGEYARYVV